jgi:SulP family sulfate permease
MLTSRCNNAFHHFRETFSQNPKNDLLSGLTVALALVPEAVAFALIAGVAPLVGLYAAFLVGLITAIFGGRPGMISGATGALAVVMVSLVADAERMFGAGSGVQYLFATVVLMGFTQVAAGLLKLGRFIRIVPYPVMLGFVNGLAIVIFLAQIPQLQSETPGGKWGWLEGTWMQGTEMMLMLGLIALVMAVTYLLPKLTRAIPSALAGIVLASVLVIAFGLPTKTVGDLATISGGLPDFAVPNIALTWETLWFILPYAIVLAAIGLIESLLTLTVIDEITETRGHSNIECVGQGLANVVTGFFGGMGGCAMIGQSMINVNSGGRGRLSGIAAALFLLSFILFGAPLIELIPVAALIGVMFVVVIGTFEWSSFRMMRRIPRHDAFIIIFVSAITVMTDLAVAVVAGVIVAALVFAWEHAKHIAVHPRVDPCGSKVYELHGPLFFGSAPGFKDLFDPHHDPEDVVIEFRHSRVYDQSGLDAIDVVATKYRQTGKRLHLRHLSRDCHTMLKNAGDLVEVNIAEDPTYRVNRYKVG